MLLNLKIPTLLLIWTILISQFPFIYPFSGTSSFKLCNKSGIFRASKPFSRHQIMASGSIFKFPSFIKSPALIAMGKYSLKKYLNPAVSGGLLSGSLHAITGPDHLAAVLPPSVGQPWSYGMRIGAIWGLGHGISATFLGICAFLLKGQFSSKFTFLNKISNIAESAVGISLILIGLVGIKEANEARKEELLISDELQITNPQIGKKSNTAIFVNGILHGFSWDGAPSLAPALALSTLRSTIGFFISYCFGTMLAMSIVAGGVGEGSVRLGKVVNSPDLPRKLSLISSIAAIGIGIFWIAQAIL